MTRTRAGVGGGHNHREDGARDGSPPGSQQGAPEDDHGVPFAGAPVSPERHTDAWTVVPRDAPLSWREQFGRDDAPRVVDLGCGNGRYLLLSAVTRADHDHLGIDLVPQAVRHAARRAGERGLTNVKYAWGDALSLLFTGLEPGTIDELHVYHPQPYYDPEQVGRRMLTPAFFGRAWRVLKPSGLLVLQTDNPYYWAYIRRVAPRFFRWRERAEPWDDAPEGRSAREIKARQRGLPIFRGLGERRDMAWRRVRTLIRHVPAPDFDANRPAFRAPPGARADGPGR